MQKLNNWGAQHAAKVVLLALLLVPAAVALLSGRSTTTEQRNLSAPPGLPHSLPDTLKYPALLDAWVNDNFGLRATLVTLNNQLRFALFGQFPTIQTINGKQGRIFMSAHQKTDVPYSAINSALGYQVDPVPGFVDETNNFTTRFAALGVDAKLVIVPSSPVVHAEQLPDWLARHFDPAAIPILRVQASPRLAPGALKNLYFPYAEMRAAATTIDVFPKTWFHWMGDGPRLVAGYTMEHFWGAGAEQGIPLKTTIETMPSDLSHLFPGLDFSSRVTAIDYKASGVDVCMGPSCFGTLRPIMEKLWQMSTYRNEKAPRGRLVIVSDSFGQPIAGWYSKYYKEVIHVCTNSIERLDEQELSQVRQYLFGGAKTDDVLFLYHDVTVHSGRLGQDVAGLLPPA